MDKVSNYVFLCGEPQRHQEYGSKEAAQRCFSFLLRTTGHLPGDASKSRIMMHEVRIYNSSCGLDQPTYEKYKQLVQTQPCLKVEGSLAYEVYFDEDTRDYRRISVIRASHIEAA